MISAASESVNRILFSRSKVILAFFAVLSTI